MVVLFVFESKSHLRLFNEFLNAFLLAMQCIRETGGEREYILWRFFFLNMYADTQQLFALQKAFSLFSGFWIFWLNFYVAAVVFPLIFHVNCTTSYQLSISTSEWNIWKIKIPIRNVSPPTKVDSLFFLPKNRNRIFLNAVTPKYSRIISKSMNSRPQKSNYLDNSIGDINKARNHSYCIWAVVASIVFG